MSARERHRPWFRAARTWEDVARDDRASRGEPDPYIEDGWWCVPKRLGDGWMIMRINPAVKL